MMEKKGSAGSNISIFLRGMLGLIGGACIGIFVTLFILRIVNNLFHCFDGPAGLGAILYVIVGGGIGGYLLAKIFLRHFPTGTCKGTSKPKLSKRRGLVIALLGIIWCYLFSIYYTAIDTNWFINWLPALLFLILCIIIFLYNVRS